MARTPKSDTGDEAQFEAESPRAARVVQKREFVDRVVEATGAKKGDVKPIVEATLDQLGRAFASGETLVVNPFGRARVSMRKSNGKGSEVINLRLRRRGDGADSDED
ncbi:HU family DNA-binding protein [Paracoccus zhejiangensis]|uniref:DNA-binding protein n=1 Tax=Paracoccus zhejiangensis TaxID=1077935 RepID=A0A2H5EWQ1_9RHOB|nr:HU family DNA-binding protein [Paracoccus zhejiangensis]AUH63710.1 DNA-binding protein [Paracoccus zhejiangensis]